MGPGSYVTSTANYYNKPARKFPVKTIVLGVVALVIIITLIAVIASLSGRDNIGTESQHLSAQLSNLTALTTDGSKHLANGDEKKLNAETAIIVDGVGANLAGTLPKKVDKNIAASESDASTTQALASAALAGTYDAAYKGALKQKLESVTALLSAMYSKTKSKTLKPELNQSYIDLQAILNNLNKLG